MLKDEHTTRYLAKNWQSILKMVTAERAHFSLLRPSDLFLASQHVFSLSVCFPLSWMPKRQLCGYLKGLILGRAGGRQVWCLAALALLCAFLNCNYSCSSASHCLCCYCCFMWLFTHQIRATITLLFLISNQGPKTPLNFKTLPIQGISLWRYLRSALPPHCKSITYLKPEPCSEGRSVSVVSPACLFDWITVADAAKPAPHRPWGAVAAQLLPSTPLPTRTMLCLRSLGSSWCAWLLLGIPMRRSPSQRDSWKLVAKAEQVDASLGSRWRMKCLWMSWF